MDLNNYQIEAAKTAKYRQSIDSMSEEELRSMAYLSYVTHGLSGESGEIADKVKKIIRDEQGHITEERLEELKKELGDVFWYLVMTCSELDLSIDQVAVANLAKLASREKRDMIGGSGDNR